MVLLLPLEGDDGVVIAHVGEGHLKLQRFRVLCDTSSQGGHYPPLNFTCIRVMPQLNMSKRSGFSILHRTGDKKAATGAGGGRTV